MTFRNDRVEINELVSALKENTLLISRSLTSRTYLPESLRCNQSLKRPTICYETTTETKLGLALLHRFNCIRLFVGDLDGELLQKHNT
jgi:hypothetical protein